MLIYHNFSLTLQWYGDKMGDNRRDQMLLKKTLFLLLFVNFISSFSGEKLYVYFPTTIKPMILEKNISDVCPNISVTVFGRYHDFITMVGTDNPDGVLIKTPLIKELSSYTISKRGVWKNKITDDYVFLSTQEINPTEIGAGVIGILDFMSKKNMDEFAASFFNTQPKVKSVTKMEDLLSLLTFNMANAILIPDSYISYFKSKSQLDFKVVLIVNNSAEIIALCIKSGKSSSNLELVVQKFTGSINSSLGVESWK